MNANPSYVALITLFPKESRNGNVLAICEDTVLKTENVLSHFLLESGIKDPKSAILGFIIFGHGKRSMELTVGGKLMKVEVYSRGNPRLVTTLIETTEDGDIFPVINADTTPERAAESVLACLRTEADERGIKFSITKKKLIEDISFGNETSGPLPIPARNTGSSFYVSARLIDC